ncbi:polysaccharide deacetylase family protein [Kaistia sp. 32K]|uniref:polysaccharide deacetylase family protein n=1 Tax=Kaistia sp. 32K TaxID=2795690 RepID=UPI001915291A|nr:polysaccharide deacetylase family protein [Kaistia sp. 32K]
MQSLKIAAYRAGLNALYWSGASRLFAPMARGSGAILMFHQVRPALRSAFQPNAHLEVTPDFLGKVVREIQAAGIDIVDLDEATRRLAEPRPARRFVVLTFDDGYRNNYTEAYPVLKALGVPFTIYVATGFVDRTDVPWWDAIVALIAETPRFRIRIGSREFDLPTETLREKRDACRLVASELCQVGEDEQRQAIDRAAREYGLDTRLMVDREMLDWDEVRTLASDPLVTIGAHTVGHYAIAKLDSARARREMAESRDRIEAMTGMRPRHFAYPYGSPSTAAEREFYLAADLGFTTAVTTRRGVVDADSRLTALPRISINGHFQSWRYVDTLLSGVPLSLERRLRSWLRRPPSALVPEASAST